MSLTVDFFEQERGRLFGLAYRMLGRPSEAEEIVQEAWLRVQQNERPIESPAGFLTTLVTRLCLDRLRSAQARREIYVGPWLPEPMQTDDEANAPDATLIRAESVSMAFLRILDQLSPVERAVFILSEAFEYKHAEIADALAISTENSRQVLRRARARVAEGEGETRFERDPKLQEATLFAFLKATGDGDLQELMELLHPDVEWTSDGGGQRTAATRPILGRERVAAFARGLWRKGRKHVRVELARVNESAAVLLYSENELDSVIGIDVTRGRIARFWAIRNPEKLSFLARQLAQKSET